MYKEANNTSITTEEKAVSTTPEQSAISQPSSPHTGNDHQNLSVHDDTHPPLSTESLSQAYVVIDKAKQDFIRAKLEETINNPRFWAKGSRYVALVSALSVPVFDDMSLQLFYLHTRNDLIKDAAELSSNTGAAVVMPTEEAIIEEVWKRWTAKEEETQIKALNKKRREDAKNGGGKYKAATPEDVKDVVAEAEATLRAEEGC